MKTPAWISTHPGSEERAAAILEYSRKQEFEPVQLINDRTWTILKNRIVAEQQGAVVKTQ